jgi:hypothetical protein
LNKKLIEVKCWLELKKKKIYMENLNGQNQSYLLNNQVKPFYHSSFSCNSNWSYLSGGSSSGFGSDFQIETLNLSSDHDSFTNSLIINQQNSQNQNESTQSLDCLMVDSDAFTHESINYTINDSNMINCENFNDSSSFVSSYQPRACFSSETIKMWQFLLELLEDKRFRHLIRWQSNSCLQSDNEFVIYDPNEIVKKWAIRQCKPSMTYKKFCRILRYYYKNKILQKTAGKSHTYYFQINIQSYLTQLGSQYQQQQEMQQQIFLNNFQTQNLSRF